MSTLHLESHPPVPQTEELSSCPVCMSEESRFLFSCSDRYYRLPGEFGLVECKECSLVRLSPRPRPNEISFYYPEEEYYSFQTPGEIKDRGFLNTLKLRMRNTVLRYKFNYPVADDLLPRFLLPLVSAVFFNLASFGLGRRLPSYIDRGYALDIGCGNGAFLHLLKSIDWRVTGVDLSLKAAKLAKATFDIDVFTGPVEEAEFDSESFDYVHMSHSIEHLPDPSVAMKKIFQLMKPGGKLYIETPNISSWAFDAMQQYWMPLECPRHLFLFSPKSLRESLENSGFAIEGMSTTHRDFGEYYYRYKAEERLGRKLQNTELSFLDRFNIFTSHLYYRFRALFDDKRGDFLHVWALKPTETQKVK